VSSTFQEDGTEAKYDFLYISREDLIHLQKREEGNSGHVHIDADISWKKLTILLINLVPKKFATGMK